MATKPRHKKTPLQLWIADTRKELGLTPLDLAQLTGVSEDTARGWESRGRPSEDAISALERRFGRPAPREAEEAGQSDVAMAIREQTAAINRLAAALEARSGWEAQLLDGLRIDRAEQRATGNNLMKALGALGKGLALPGTTDEETPRTHEGAQRVGQ